MPLSFFKKLFEKPSAQIHSRDKVVKEQMQKGKQPSTIQANNSSNSSLFKLDIFNSYLSQEEAKCPYCLEKLEKPPTRKRKCPHCKETMYGRTLPVIKRKVVVTEKQRNKVDQYNLIVSELEMYGNDYIKKYREIKNDLKSKWGFEPEDRDVFWQLINKYRINMASSKAWGLYRNATHRMAEFLALEGKLESSLDLYIEVHYIDTNGAGNSGQFHNDETTSEYNFSDLAPALVAKTLDIKEQLNLTDEEFKDRYIKISSITKQSLQFPIESKKSWFKFEKEMKSFKD